MLKLNVTRDGKSVGTVEPGMTQFAQQGQTKLEAKVLSEPLRDIFVVFQGGEKGQLTINVKVNPLISFAWGGFAILLLGTALAAWPKAGGELRAVPVTRGKTASSSKSRSKTATR